MDDVLRSVIDLALHLNRLLLLMGHLYSQDAESRASQIQSNEVPLLCNKQKQYGCVTFGAPSNAFYYYSVFLCFMYRRRILI